MNKIEEYELMLELKRKTLEMVKEMLEKDRVKSDKDTLETFNPDGKKPN